MISLLPVAVMAALMPFTVVMMPAVVSFAMVMVMMVASGVGIKLERSFGQRLSCRVCGAAHTAEKLNASLGQRILSPNADTSADQSVSLGCFQEPGKCSMAAAVGIDDLLSDNLSVLHIIELELLCVSEMLKDFPVFKGYCDSHDSCSFLDDIIRSLIIKPIVAATDQKPFAVYESFRNLTPGTLVNSGHGGSGNTHPFSALFLRQALAIEQADRFKLIQTHHDRFFGRCFLG
jgi:hypothetical protein